MTRQVAVIGAGFGGLALAVRLQSAGIATTLIEARDRPGGRAYVWKDEGFTFDAGPTVITDPACIEELFALSGRKRADYVDLIPISPFYRLHLAGRVAVRLRQRPGPARQPDRSEKPRRRRRLPALPEVLRGRLRRGLQAARPRAVPEDHRHAGRRAAADAAAGVAQRLLQGVRLRRRRHLRQALSFHTLLVGGSPFAASSIYALIHALERDGGVWFAARRHRRAGGRAARNSSRISAAS